jgi:hypothetical protein
VLERSKRFRLAFLAITNRLGKREPLKVDNGNAKDESVIKR